MNYVKPSNTARRCFTRCQQNPRACFTKAVFWIQMLGLPTYLEDEATMEELLSDTGRVLEVDLQYKPVRDKVEMTIKDPFMPGILLNIVGENWIQFSYEYLPTICYRSRIIGHIADDFPNFLNEQHAIQDPEHPLLPYHRLNGRMRAVKPKPKQLSSTSSSSNQVSGSSPSTLIP